MIIIRYYFMISNHEYNTILDKPFVLVGMVKFEDVFPGLRSNEFLNSLYITLGTLEICFSLSSILSYYETSQV